MVAWHYTTQATGTALYHRLPHARWGAMSVTMPVRYYNFLIGHIRSRSQVRNWISKRKEYLRLGYLELEQEPVVVSFLWCFPEALLLDGNSFGCSPEAFARERSRCLCVEWGCVGLAETVADTGGLAVAVDAMPLVPAPSCANAPPPLSTELLAALPTLMLDLTPRTWLLVLLLVAQVAPPWDFVSKISKCHTIIEIHRAETRAETCHVWLSNCAAMRRFSFVWMSKLL